MVFFNLILILIEILKNLSDKEKYKNHNVLLRLPANIVEDNMTIHIEVDWIKLIKVFIIMILEKTNNNNNIPDQIWSIPPFGG